MNVISILGDFGATASAAKTSAKRLQAALATLGKVVGSAKLKVVVDGAIGPATVAAVNWAFTNHVGPGQAPAELRTGKLALAYVKANADTLATYLEREINRRGAVAASPATVAKGAAIQAINTAPPASAATVKVSVKRLQNALVKLGKATGSAKLKVAVDGALGAKTVAAVNWAFTQHIGSGQAPAPYRTGTLALAFVKANADALAALIEKEAARRATAAPTAVAVTAAQAKAAAAIPVTKAAVKDLQSALVNLGKVAGSAVLKVAVDGALGPKTVAAVNWAFTKHVGPGQAPANLRTGTLTLADVKANIGQLTNLLFVETRRRGGAALIPTTTAIPVHTKSGKVVQATRVQTPAGETYKVEDPETKQTYYTTDPTAAEPPPAPESLPEPTPQQEAVAATASAAAGKKGKATVVSPKQVPSQEAVDAATEAATDAGAMVPSGMTPGAGMITPTGGESFFSQYKWPILGGVGAILIVTGIVLTRKKSPGASPAPSFQPQPARKAVRA